MSSSFVSKHCTVTELWIFKKLYFYKDRSVFLIKVGCVRAFGYVCLVKKFYCKHKKQIDKLFEDRQISFVIIIEKTWIFSHDAGKLRHRNQASYRWRKIIARLSSYWL